MNAEQVSDQLPVFTPCGLDREKLVRSMQSRRLDGILLSSPENVFYTTGYTGLPSSGNPILFTLRNIYPFFSLITARGEILLICWDFSTWKVAFGADQILGFSSTSQALEVLKTALMEHLPRQGALGVESTCPLFALDAIHQALPTPGLAPVDDLMLNLRLIKSHREIELIEESTAIIEKTLSQLYADLRPGISRLDFMQRARVRLFENGISGIGHMTFSFGEANPEIAIGERLEPGHLVTLDLGGIYQGYRSDNRRYAYTGAVPESLLEHYRTMVAIVDGVGEALTPGATYAEVFHKALDLFEQHRIALAPGREFNHVGHNLGLATEEDWLTDNASRRVEPGMVINIELYSQAPTGDLIGDEETYVIGESGPERISQLPREIRRV